MSCRSSAKSTLIWLHGGDNVTRNSLPSASRRSQYRFGVCASKLRRAHEIEEAGHRVDSKPATLPSNPVQLGYAVKVDSASEFMRRASSPASVSSDQRSLPLPSRRRLQTVGGPHRRWWDSVDFRLVRDASAFHLAEARAPQLADWRQHRVMGARWHLKFSVDNQLADKVPRRCRIGVRAEGPRW